MMMTKFKQKFDENYEFLYNSHCNGREVAGEREALNYFDYGLTDFQKQFLADFVIYRGDLVVSDRECIAFAFTLDDMDIGF